MALTPRNVLADASANDGFSFITLTAEANNKPYRPGQIGKSGLFEEEGITTTTFMVEGTDGNLSIVEPTPRGGAGETISHDKGEGVPFTCTHLQRDDSVFADEVQNVRQLGSADETPAVKSVFDKKVDRHLADIDTTIEHQRVGTIKGKVYAKSGALITDMYKKFGAIKPKTVKLKFTDPDFDIRKGIYSALLGIEDALGEESNMLDHVHSYCGKEAWIEMLTHPKFMESYLATEKARAARDLPMNDVVNHAGVTWERYKTGSKANKANKGKDWIEPDESRFVPFGIPGLFKTIYGPADHIETVNTEGLPRYVSQEIKKKSMEIEVQSNPANICLKPLCLIEGRIE